MQQALRSETPPVHDGRLTLSCYCKNSPSCYVQWLPFCVRKRSGPRAQRLPPSGQGVEARCPSGWERQTSKHVVIFCPNLTGRDRMLVTAGTTEYATLLGSKKGLHVVMPWLIQRNILPQFNTVKEMAAEDRSGLRPFQPLGWEERIEEMKEYSP
jgi:hypothetical protein